MSGKHERGADFITAYVTNPLGGALADNRAALLTIPTDFQDRISELLLYAPLHRSESHWRKYIDSLKQHYPSTSLTKLFAQGGVELKPPEFSYNDRIDEMAVRFDRGMSLIAKALGNHNADPLQSTAESESSDSADSPVIIPKTPKPLHPGKKRPATKGPSPNAKAIRKTKK